MSRVREFFRNRFLAVGTALALLMNCAFWLYVSDRIIPQAQNLPIHYNIYFGIDLVAPWWYLFFLPAAGFSALLVNTIISVILLRREKIVGYFLTVTSVLLQGAFFFAAYLILTQV